MEQLYSIAGYKIAVTFKESSVHIVNDEQLWAMLNADRLGNSKALAALVRADFEAMQKRPLQIEESSLIVEIWGHVYIDYFAKMIHDFLPVNILESLVNKVQDYCAVIDCGEKGSDSNRFLWDMLSGQMKNIDKILPEKINVELLK